MKFNIARIPSVAMALVAFATVVYSCGQTVEPETEVSFSLSTTVADNKQGSQFVRISAGSEWTIGFVEPCDWASLSATSGKGTGHVILNWTENAGEITRTCIIELRSASGKFSHRMEFSQKPDVSRILVSDPVAGWLELPAVPEGLYFFTHPMVIGSTTTRNYSYAWDKDALVAHWVAYPLNSSLKQGSSGRSEAWGGYDPKFPQKYQPDLHSAYQIFGARGHQIPSADRQIYKYNVETFYSVNMTPQDYTFNSGTWSQLEGFVRSQSDLLDTLYVATGCVVKGSTRYALDNSGKKVTVPVGYFKALLGYKKSGTVGITGKTGGYTGVAYYYPNEPSSADFRLNEMTIRELEEKMGIDFFVNLPDKIGKALSDKVETTRDSWWDK